jgi:hypothetical protein
MRIPGVAILVYGRERHAAVYDLEEGLVLQVQGAKSAAGNGFREPNDGIVGDHCAALEWCCERSY